MVEVSGNGTKEFTYLDYGSGSPQLRLCPGGMADDLTDETCPVIWPKMNSSGVPAAPSGAAGVLGKRDNDISLKFYPESGTLDVSPYIGLTVDGIEPTSAVTLNQDCLQAIKWPYDQYVNDGFLLSMLLIVL